MAMDRTLLGVRNSVGSYGCVKVDETGRKSCQRNLMRAEVTDVGHLAGARVGREQVKQARAEERTVLLAHL